jgi:hypothetical protein
MVTTRSQRRLLSNTGTNMYPRVYRGFVVKNEESVMRVDSVLDAVLDTGLIDRTKCDNPFKINLSSIDNWTDKMIEQQLDFWFNHIKKILEELKDDDLPAELNVPIEMFRGLFAKMILRHLRVFQTLTNIRDKHKCVSEILKKYLDYHQVCFNKHLRMLGLKQAMVKKCIQFCDKEGMIESFLTFAYFYPDMISEDCYPNLNKSGICYKITNKSTLKDDTTLGKLYTKYKRYI